MFNFSTRLHPTLGFVNWNLVESIGHVWKSFNKSLFSLIEHLHAWPTGGALYLRKFVNPSISNILVAHDYSFKRIDHFTVVYSVTWPLNGSEAGGDLALIQTSLVLSCKIT